MNTKAKKNIIGIILAAIMIASVFAVIAPATTADPEAPVGNPAGFSVNKETIPDPAAAYNIGDPITYQIRMENDKSAFNAHVNVWDVLPNGTKLEWKGNATQDFPVGSGEQTWEFETTVQADWIDWSDPQNPIFTNTVYVEGYVDNPSALDEIHQDVDHTSTLNVEPPEFEFDWEPACCYNISFSGSADKPVGNYTWDFGDGETEVHEEDLPGETFHVYDDCGEYTVTLSGWSLDGTYLYNETKKDIYVDCGPQQVTARAEPECYEKDGTEITFKATATSDMMNPDPLEIKKWEWTFDDEPGTVYEGQEVTRMVTEDITATVEVWVGLEDDTLCCSDTDTVEVEQCAECTLRIYGTFNEGPGDLEVPCENKPYTDPIAPFFPQSEQAPRKDFITFNPAIMSHNEIIGTSGLHYPGLNYFTCPCEENSRDVETPKEKVFERMWYENEWFKDENCNGVWDVVTDDGVMPLEVWKAIPLEDRPAIREYNSPNMYDYEHGADIYGPALNHEFTYMFTDSDTMPVMIGMGSEVLIPMASWESNDGLDSFDADGDGFDDYVFVDSEETLADRWGTRDEPDPNPADIDGDGLEPIGDMAELNGDETLILNLREREMTERSQIQFFDHVVELRSVYGDPGLTAQFYVYSNEDVDPESKPEDLVVLEPGEVRYFYRGDVHAQMHSTERPTFYLKLISADDDDDTAVVEIGRLFGETHATICGTNEFWSQKAFMVDDVFYNVVAIKALGDEEMCNCIKYITFRQKLPKTPIKLYGNDLKVWYPRETLPEMPPFNMDHIILRDVQDTWTIPDSMQDKIGSPMDMPPLRIDYVAEDIEKRYAGELKEIYYEPEIMSSTDEEDERWLLEWFWTQPWQYTELRLPKDDKYLVTLAWEAPESEFVIWDGDSSGPVHHFPQDFDDNGAMTEQFKMRFKFWYEDCTGPIYIDDETSSIRLYGTFGEGAGDRSMEGVENKPYTDPMGPFFPQSEQAPAKDFITFNPAIMDHNQGYPELDYFECWNKDVQTPKEKVFKRMWYENEWFKDENCNGVWDVVTSDGVMTLDEWKAILLEDRPTLREYNSPDAPGYEDTADIYGPAVNQEFTYMTLDDHTMPIMVGVGSRVLIPMASWESGNGLDSFDADGDGYRDALRVDSEDQLADRWDTRGMPDPNPADIDGDGLEVIDRDGIELSGDESLVLSLPNKEMTKGSQIQLFDHVVKLHSVYGDPGLTAQFYVYPNEDVDPEPRPENMVVLEPGQIQYFYRGMQRAQMHPTERPTFYLKLITADDDEDAAIVEVGRLFGNTYANICGMNEFWSQKAFMVDDVFYNVVAIKGDYNCFKYITFRQKLPKTPIKLYGNHLKVWDPEVILPEMPPFNEDHEICIDVQNTWTIPESMQDKIGPKRAAAPLEICYVEEDVEERFKGELKEIYWEGHGDNAAEVEGMHEEIWLLEWFWTQPWQYTAFVLPDDQLYLVTLAWYAPESIMLRWDGGELGEEPMILPPEYRRVKFWYDPADNTDLYVNRVGDAPSEQTVDMFYGSASNDGNGDDVVDLEELVNAILDYLNREHDTYSNPFTSGQFGEDDLLDYLEAFIDQERP